MRLRILLLPLLLFSPSLLLGQLTIAQTADDFFHGGAMFYLSNNILAAKEVVTNGLQRFPDNEKLQKLWELLNQQQPSQSQQQKQQQQPEPQPQDQKPDPQEQPQQQQQQQQRQQQQQDARSGEQKPEPQKEKEAREMTPEEAKQLLDAQKGDEQVLQFRPPDKPRERGKVLKDW
jgi:outer membrane biosynthesis protein TonB